MRRVFIVGQSLFAEALAQMLTSHDSAGAIEIIGSMPTLETALPFIDAEDPDAVIVAGTGQTNTAIFGSTLATHPDLPLIWADPDANNIQVITSQCVVARSADLLAAIAALPKRR